MMELLKAEDIKKALDAFAGMVTPESISFSIQFTESEFKTRFTSQNQQKQIRHQ